MTPVLQRTPREMEQPASGLLFHLVAGLFVLGTIGLVAMWTLRLVKAHRIEGELDNAVAGKDYAVAVDRAVLLQTAAPRLSRNKWKRRQAELCLDWAKHCLTQDDYAQAAKRAAEAGDAGDRAGIKDDDAFRKEIHLTAAKAAFGQLDQDWDTLSTFEEQISRCRSFLEKYHDTPEADDVGRRLAVVQREKKQAEDDWRKIDTEIVRLFGYAQVAEALDAVRKYRASRDPRNERHIKLADGRIKKYAKLVDQGFLRLGTPVKLAAGAPLARSALRIRTPGVDLFPLYRVVRASPAAGNAACFTREQGMLYCLDAETGRLRWALHQGLGAEFEPALVGQAALCVAAWGRKLANVDPKTGNVAWCVELPQPVATHPVAVDQGAAVLDMAGTLRIIDAASGNVVAQRDIGRSWSKLVSNGENHVALIGPSRAMLFQRGGRWVDVGAILIRSDCREQLFMMGRHHAAALPMNIDANAPAKRLFLWHSQGITAMKTATTAHIGSRWRLAHHRGQMQVWIDETGICHCTRLNSGKSYDPVEPLGNTTAPDARDGRLIKTGRGQGLLTISGIIRFYTIDQTAAAGKFTAKWTLSVGQPRPLSDVRILPGDGDLPVVRGRDREAPHAPGFVRLQVAPDGKAVWNSRLGPNVCDPPGVCGPRAAWSDREAGLWTVNGKGKVQHHRTGLSGQPGDRVHVAADADGFVVHTRTQLMALDAQLGRGLWRSPTNVAAKIAAVRLDAKMVVVLTADGKLAAYERKTGAAMASAAPPKSLGAPVTVLSGGSTGRVVLAAADGRGVEASLVGAAARRTWRFGQPWRAIPGYKNMVRIQTGYAACGQGGWRKVPSTASAGLADGLTRALHVEGDTLLVADGLTGRIAHIDLARPRELWSGQTAAPAAWAVKLSPERFAVLIPPRSLTIVDRANGSVVAQIDLDGVPTAAPARCGKDLWIPVSGYRLVKLPVAQLLAARTKPKPTTQPTTAPASRPATMPGTQP